MKNKLTHSEQFGTHYSPKLKKQQEERADAEVKMIRKHLETFGSLVAIVIFIAAVYFGCVMFGG